MKRSLPTSSISPKSPDFYTGSVIEAEDLQFRDAFIDHLWESLQPMNVLLKAPRRCGKTSVIPNAHDIWTFVGLPLAGRPRRA
jgi:hypothetical protein